MVIKVVGEGTYSLKIQDERLQKLIDQVKQAILVLQMDEMRGWRILSQPDLLLLNKKFQLVNPPLDVFLAGTYEGSDRVIARW